MLQSHDASVEDLEDHLVELTKKGGNTRGVLRKLILMHCRKHNLERALALEQVRYSGFSVNDASSGGFQNKKTVIYYKLFRN